MVNPIENQGATGDPTRRSLEAHPSQVDEMTLGCPILRLPFDALYIIFLDILQEELAERPRKRITTPTICSQVCDAWRKSTLAMPILWSNIWFLTPQSMAPDALDEQALWIKRSQDAGLRIVISRSNNRVITRIMRLLRPEVERWESFIVIHPIKPRTVHAILDGLRDARAPMLQVMRVLCDREIGRWRFQAFGGGAPALRELDISCGRYKAPPFSQLTRLHIYSGTNVVSPDDLLRLLSTAGPTLGAFAFNSSAEHGPRKGSPFPSITLPNIHTLDIQYTLYCKFHRMDTFPFPRVRVLSLLCHLTEPVPPSPDLSILSLLPDLEDLTINGIYTFSGRFLTTCLTLQSLTLNLDRPLWCSWVIVLREAIEARRQECALKGVKDSLTHVSVRGFSMGRTDLEWLKDNIVEFKYNWLKREAVQV